MGQKTPTVGSAFNTRRNSLNAIRLILAALVIVSHSWPVGGYGLDPYIGDLSLGTWAVAGFFAISGYLITLSRDRSHSVVDFFWRRALRIFPGFIGALVVVAFVFAPINPTISGRGDWEPLGAVTYVLKNLSLVILQGYIPNTLPDTPIPEAWNGALWTLKWEFLCYIAIGLAFTLIARRYVKTAVWVGFAGCLAVTTAAHLGVDLGYSLPLFALLAAYFVAGALLYLHRDHVPLTRVWAGAAALLLVGVMLLGWAGPLAPAMVAYLVIWLGRTLPLHRVAAKNDISYGMYIYGFPVQQTLVSLFGQDLPVFIFVALSIALAVPLAYASWFAIERPALHLKKLTAKAPVDNEGHVRMPA
jgi:peptidoglycan/LPS O-acetylase OafA/YrhL